MSNSQPGLTDASFFSLVHHVLCAHRSSDTGSASPDRPDRQRPTRMQYVAPYVEGRMPSSNDFMHVRCHELSLGGFSFLVEYPPDYDQVLVGLGTGPIILMSARVVSHSPIAVDGQSWHLVACQFVARIESGMANFADLPCGASA